MLAGIYIWTVVTPRHSFFLIFTVSPRCVIGAAKNKVKGHLILFYFILSYIMLSYLILPGDPGVKYPTTLTQSMTSNAFLVALPSISDAVPCSACSCEQAETWISNHIYYKVWDWIAYHSQTSTVQPLKFGNVWVGIFIPNFTEWLLIDVGI